jgi:hypothetical protein
MMKLSGVLFLAALTYFKHQRQRLFPAIRSVFKHEQSKLVEQLKSVEKVSLSGDGR